MSSGTAYLTRRRQAMSPISPQRVQPLPVVVQNLLLRALRQVRPLLDDLHRVRELAVPVAVVGRVDDDALAERVDDVGAAPLVGVGADEAAARQEVVARLPVDD